VIRTLLTLLVIGLLAAFFLGDGWKGDGKGGVPGCDRSEPADGLNRAGEGGYWRVKERTPLRTGPGASYAAEGAVTPGLFVRELSRHDDWIFVRTEDGKRAWVSKFALENPDARPSAKATN